MATKSSLRARKRLPFDNLPLPNRKAQRLIPIVTRIEFTAVTLQCPTIMHIDRVTPLCSALGIFICNCFLDFEPVQFGEAFHFGKTSKCEWEEGKKKSETHVDE